MIEQYSKIIKKNLKIKPSYKAERKGDVRKHFADISNAEKILGYKPRIKLKEGIEKYLHWVMNE